MGLALGPTTAELQDRDYAIEVGQRDSDERDCLIVAEGAGSWWRPSDWWEIVGIRDADGALRVRHLERGTLSWFGFRYVTPLTNGAARFLDEVDRQWITEAKRG